MDFSPSVSQEVAAGGGLTGLREAAAGGVIGVREAGYQGEGGGRGGTVSDSLCSEGVSTSGLFELNELGEVPDADGSLFWERCSSLSPSPPPGLAEVGEAERRMGMPGGAPGVGGGRRERSCGLCSAAQVALMCSYLCEMHACIAAVGMRAYAHEMQACIKRMCARVTCAVRGR